MLGVHTWWTPIRSIDPFTVGLRSGAMFNQWMMALYHVDYRALMLWYLWTHPYGCYYRFISEPDSICFFFFHHTCNLLLRLCSLGVDQLRYGTFRFRRPLWPLTDVRRQRKEVDGETIWKSVLKVDMIPIGWHSMVWPMLMHCVDLYLVLVLPEGTSNADQWSRNIWTMVDGPSKRLHTVEPRVKSRLGEAQSSYIFKTVHLNY